MNSGKILEWDWFMTWLFSSRIGERIVARVAASKRPGGQELSNNTGLFRAQNCRRYNESIIFHLNSGSFRTSDANAIYWRFSRIHYLHDMVVRKSVHFVTGVPILTVLATELTHKSTGWRHQSWWLIYGSGVYNIFVSCVATMLAIFMLLYIGVLWKAHALVEENVVKRETLERR